MSARRPGFPLEAGWLGALFFGLLSLVAGCAAPKRSGPQQVPLEALDPQLAELWRAYLAGDGPEDTARFEAERTKALSDPRAVRFLVDNLAHEMVTAFERESGFEKASEHSRFLRAESELVRFGPASVPLLVGMLEEGDGVIARLAGDCLVRIGPPAGPALLDGLEAQAVEVRRRVAELLNRMPPLGSSDAFLVRRLETAAFDEPDPLARAWSIEALGVRARAGGEGLRVASDLVRLLGDPEPLFVARAARGLGAIGDGRLAEDLIAAFDRAAQQGDASLARSIQAALVEIAQAEGLSPAAFPKGPKDWAKLWAAWREQRHKRVLPP